jgi:hypothetical protein
MATNKRLEDEVNALKELLARHGIIAPSEVKAPRDLADYIPHGSEAHGVFLGLIALKDEAEADGRLTYRSPTSDKLYCLEDEVTPFVHYPDPKQVAALVLRQKVSELETLPTVPKDAPPLWRPVDQAVSGVY